ncbi:unnamed protein product [Dicrocoelium dendriticum]|nr:unnamed protein product [Dicrocoelium dendriticum]
MPRWMLVCTHSTCPLPEAQKVLVKDPAGVYYTVDVMTSIIDSDDNGVCVGSSRGRKSKMAPRDATLEMHKTSGLITYFFYKRLKYIWNEERSQFCLLSESNGRPYCQLFPPHPLPEPIVLHRRTLYEANEIAIHLTPVIKMLLTECLNPFYCFQVFSCILWFFEEYWMYATCIIVLSIISLCMQVYDMRRNDIALKKTICNSSLVTVCREVNGISAFFAVDSTELVPGDIIEIPRIGCMMHCDAFVLTGNCIVNESTLTGESVPVTKTPLPERQRRDDVVANLPTVAKHVLFGGTSVIQTRNYADERVLAMVARTGFRTAKGELVLSILYPKPMKFKFTQDALRYVGALAGISVIGLAVSVYLMHSAQVIVWEIVLRSLDLVTIAVPPALPVAMTVGVVFAQRRLRTQQIYCINPSAINVCGVINVTCFDKTGTLTEDGMDLWGVIPNTQGVFGKSQVKPNELDRGPLLEAMATCHSLTRIEGVLSGDPLDLKMFQSTNWEFLEEVSEDHCKFEMAVPAIVRPVPKGSFTNVTLESTIEPEMIPYEVGILRHFTFSSSMQRMSVIARVLNSSHFSVYTKGAPEMIERLCRQDTIPSSFHSVLMQYTREGYRVLALAWRPLKVSYTRMLKIPRERVETDLLFLGFLIMENRLKPESAPVIETLREANIRPIMVTGDNMLTALSVARDCGMIDESDRIIIVSAKPPPPKTSSSQTPDGDTGFTAHVRDNDVSAANPANSKPSVAGLKRSLEYSQDTSSVEEGTATLVEFHYAEDLHKPVTEVTATSAGARGWRGHRSRRPRWKVFPFLSSLFSRGKRSSSAGDVYHTVDTVTRYSLTTPVEIPGTVAVDSVFDAEADGHVHSLEEPVASHRVTIRMIDRPDFHLAISGKTWAVIKEHYPWLIPKLVVKGTVFARFSPEQKTQLIESLQLVGYYVAMCGDGANDCGALKAAHAGIALSDAEASVASPFTSKQQNIGCVPTLIRDGRCALVTSFGTFKFMSGYSLVQFFTVILLYTIGGNMSDAQFLFIDLFIITTLSVTFGYAKAYPHLSVEPPNMRLVSVVTLMSLGLQLLVNCILQTGIFIWVRVQPCLNVSLCRYIALYKVSTEYELDNYEGTAVFIVAVYQYIILAIVFSKGAPYRRCIFYNYLFVINLVVCVGVSAYVTSYPADIILHLMEMTRIPSAQFLMILHALVVANFLLCYILEMIVDGVSFRRRMLHIRRALFPRHVQRKDYERIREEIDRMAGSWPPIIRSASVQALPRELFHDTYTVPMPAAPPPGGRARHRTTSGMSSSSEDDNWSPVPSRSDIARDNADSLAGGEFRQGPTNPHSVSGQLTRCQSLGDLHLNSYIAPPLVHSGSTTNSAAGNQVEECHHPAARPVFLVEKRSRSRSTGHPSAKWGSPLTPPR